MRILSVVSVLLACFLPAGLHSEPAALDQIDSLRLEFLLTTKRWSCWESSVVLEEQPQSGQPVLRQNIAIDHYGGDKKYPVGWPRMYFAVKGDEGKWMDYDSVHFDIQAETSRQDTKNLPLTLQIGNQSKENFTKALYPVPGEWQSISVPLADLPPPQQIVHFGFNISDSSYQHGDVLTFRFRGFALQRSKLCRVDQLTVTGPAIFTGSAQLNLELSISGPAAEAARGVPFQISQGSTILRQETLPVPRGRTAMTMDVSELHLAPGRYTLTAYPDLPERQQVATFTVIQSPWENHQ
ncbi:MAG: hypothetical protein GX564_12680 [Oligosphaeraceae bacterium]|nr:hypothetical protein [Oligosphaeraceae bacterium]